MTRGFKNPERMVSVGLVVAGVAWALQSLGLHYGSVAAPGPGFFPLNLSLLLVGLALWVAVLPCREHGNPTAPGGAGQVVAITAVTLMVALLMESLGFLITVFCAMVAFLRLAGAGFVVAIALGAASTLASHLLFAAWLGVPLPGGVLQDVVTLP